MGKFKRLMTSVVAVGVLTSSTVVAKPPKIKPPSTLIQKTSGPKPEKSLELMLKRRDPEGAERVDRLFEEIISKKELEDMKKSFKGYPPLQSWEVAREMGLKLYDILTKQGIKTGTPKWERAINSFKYNLSPQDFENFRFGIIIGPSIDMINSLPPTFFNLYNN